MPGLTSAYEGLVGWRYLLRRRRKPAVLVIGLVVLASAPALAGSTWFWLEHETGQAVDIFNLGRPWVQGIFIAAGGLAALGFCLVLFGALNTFLTVFSAFSTFMVTIGVAEVILVLGVMNGFQADLRKKIIDAHAHVVIEPPRGQETFAGYREIAQIARGVEGVRGASPYLEAEVMLSSLSNLSPVLLKGIDVETVAQANRLPEQLKFGTLDALIDPSSIRRIDIDDHPELLREVRSVEELFQLQAAQVPVTDAGDAGDLPGPLPDDPELAAFGMALPRPTRRVQRDPPGLLLGAELRRNLGVWPGETINVVSPRGDLGPQGPIPKSRPFRMAGWYESGMLEFDTHMAYTSLGAVQRYVGVDDVAGGIQVRVADLDEAPQVRARLIALLGDRARVSDWQERNQQLFGALQLEKVAMFLVLTINILLAAFAITGTLVMTIMERKREIAILAAMGATRAGILRIFVSQGAFTGLLGSLVGGTLGLAVGLSLQRWGLPMNPDVYYINTIPVDLRATDVVAIIAVALLVSLASTIYPALYASNLRPVEGLSAD